MTFLVRTALLVVMLGVGLSQPASAAPGDLCATNPADPSCAPGVGPVPQSQNGAATPSPTPGAPGAAPGAPGAANPISPAVDFGDPNAGIGAEFADAGSIFMNAVNDGAIKAVVGDDGDPGGGVLGFLIYEVLGVQSASFSPIVSCRDLPPGAQKDNCKPWFLDQIKIMRQLGFLLVMPLMMLVIIQSILRGSLFLLLRATLILLPVAIFGSIIIAALAQLLLNISDDLAAAMFAMSGGNFDELRAGIRSMDGEGEGMSWFGLVFLIVTFISAVIIIIEMILREVGVYVTVLFLPLAFAGLVWPASARWAKRLFEIMVGLIFSKVFVAGGLALGLGAVEAGAGGLPQDQPGLLAVTKVAAILVLTGWFSVRMMSWSPGGDGAQQGRIGNPSNVLGMGEWTQTRRQKK